MRFIAPFALLALVGCDALTEDISGKWKGTLTDCDHYEANGYEDGTTDLTLTFSNRSDDGLEYDVVYDQAEVATQLGQEISISANLNGKATSAAGVIALELTTCNDYTITIAGQEQPQDCEDATDDDNVGAVAVGENADGDVVITVPSCEGELTKK